MKKCVMCGIEFEEKESQYYCEKCLDKMKIVKKLEMVDKAEKLIAKKKRNMRRIAETVDVSEFSEIVRKRIMDKVDNFSSVPEVAVAIQMQRIGLSYETQKVIAGKNVDFYLPEIKIILEIDGGLYHTDENKTFLRDRQIMHEVGEEWEIVHIDADLVPKYTWNLKEALPYVVSQRNEQHRFRDSLMDSDFLQDFKNLEFYLKGSKKYDNKGTLTTNKQT